VRHRDRSWPSDNNLSQFLRSSNSFDELPITIRGGGAPCTLLESMPSSRLVPPPGASPPMRMAASWSGPAMIPPNTRLWRECPEAPDQARSPRLVCSEIKKVLPLRKKLTLDNESPIQRVPARSVRRPHLGRHDARQPTPAMVRFHGLCSVVRAASHWSGLHPVRRCHLRDHPPQAVEDRRPGAYQRPTDQGRNGVGVSVPGCLRAGTCAIVYGSSLTRTRQRADHIHPNNPARSGGVAELLSKSLQVATHPPQRSRHHRSTAQLRWLLRWYENSGLTAPPLSTCPTSWRDACDNDSTDAGSCRCGSSPRQRDGGGRTSFNCTRNCEHSSQAILAGPIVRRATHPQPSKDATPHVSVCNDKSPSWNRS